MSQRNILRPIVNDKYVEMFSNYERDLFETEKTFDQFKVNTKLGYFKNTL